MRKQLPWLAFLTMCFALTGLVGLFASYSTSIPLERALHRLETAAPTPDQLAIMAEGRAEHDAVATRTRLMLGVVTVLAAGVGAGLLLIAARQTAGVQPERPNSLR
jgi:hypothetical protein